MHQCTTFSKAKTSFSYKKYLKNQMNNVFKMKVIARKSDLFV